MNVTLVEELDDVVEKKESQWEGKDPPCHARDVVVLLDPFYQPFPARISVLVFFTLSQDGSNPRDKKFVLKIVYQGFPVIIL